MNISQNISPDSLVFIPNYSNPNGNIGLRIRASAYLFRQTFSHNRADMIANQIHCYNSQLKTIGSKTLCFIKSTLKNIVSLPITYGSLISYIRMQNFLHPHVRRATSASTVSELRTFRFMNYHYIIITYKISDYGITV